MPLNRLVGLILLTCLCLLCQSTGSLRAQPTDSLRRFYKLEWHLVDKDTNSWQSPVPREFRFSDALSANSYLASLVRRFQAAGYLSASIDSLSMDSGQARIWLYAGDRYVWKELALAEQDPALRANIGWNDRQFHNRAVRPEQVDALQERILRYYENTGYPFARILLDSVRLDGEEARAVLRVERGPLYHIDSIRIMGKARLSEKYLQNYLGLEKGSIYNREKLERVSPRLKELLFVQETEPWKLTMLGSGSFLDLYLDPKRASQVNALIGFLPSNQQLEGNRLLLTGEVNVMLRNALGGGETLGLNWQQLQVKSPRLNVLFQFPFLLGSRFGFDFNFDLFKKDSSFLNLNTQVGISYSASGRKTGKVFFQALSTNLLEGGIDTARIKQVKQLPPFVDVRSSNLGVDYQFSGTDYRYNPRKGREYQITISGGLRRIRQSNTITSLTVDNTGQPFDFGSLYDTLPARSYLLRSRFQGAQYLRTGRSGTFKLGLQAGWLLTEQPFRNELFQIGGYKLLRGFDEESIFASRYVVGIVEYRILFGQNNFFFLFSDLGYAGQDSYERSTDNLYLGLGGGMTFETRAGIFNLTIGAGRTDEESFNLRRLKIHFGLISLF